MNVHYVNDEWIEILFSSLVIKVSSLQTMGMEISSFVKKSKLNWKTNGKLMVTHEMMSSHPHLSDFAAGRLVSPGLVYREDYAFVEEELFFGVEGRESFTFVGKELNGTIDIPWLNSRLTKKGCYVSMATEGNRFSYIESLTLKELLICWNSHVGFLVRTSNRAMYLLKLKEALSAKGIEVEGFDISNPRVLERIELVRKSGQKK